MACLLILQFVNKCVKRELAVPQTVERFGVQTHYYRLIVRPVMRVTENDFVRLSTDKDQS